MAIYLLVTLNKGQKKDADLEMKEGEHSCVSLSPSLCLCVCVCVFTSCVWMTGMERNKRVEGNGINTSRQVFTQRPLIISVSVMVSVTDRLALGYKKWLTDRLCVQCVCFSSKCTYDLATLNCVDTNRWTTKKKERREGEENHETSFLPTNRVFVHSGN